MFGRPAIVALVLTSPFCGRVDEDLPDSLGTFTVESRLVSNTCGQGGYPVASVTELEANLRGYPGEDATFSWTGGSGRVSGIATTNGVYSFQSSQTTTKIAAEPSILYPGCQLTENSAMTFTVTPRPTPPGDAGVDETDYAFTGRLTIDVSPTSGSDCTPLLGVNGGTWAAVPCQVLVDLVGSRVE